MNDNHQEGVIRVVSPEVAATMDVETKAAIDSQIATAKQYPRDIIRSLNAALAIATLDEDTAKSCRYAVPRGGKTITGPSIHMARILAREWGNLRVAARVSNITRTELESEAICHDLESNFAVKITIKRRIVDKRGNRFNDDMIVVTGNAANSIASRNAILAVIPKNVVDKVYNAAIEKITGDLSDEAALIGRRRAALDHFRSTHGVDEDTILDRLGKTAVEQIKAEEIALLIGIDQAIKDGDTTVQESFPSTVKQRAKSKADKGLDAVKAAAAKR